MQREEINYHRVGGRARSGELCLLPGGKGALRQFIFREFGRDEELMCSERLKTIESGHFLYFLAEQVAMKKR